MVKPHLLHATKKLHATNLNYFISAVKRNIFPADRARIVHLFTVFRFNPLGKCGFFKSAMG